MNCSLPIPEAAIHKNESQMQCFVKVRLCVNSLYSELRSHPCGTLRAKGIPLQIVSK